MFTKTLLAAALATGCAMTMAMGSAEAAGFVCAYKEAPNAPKDLPPATGLTEDMTQVEARNRVQELVGDMALAKIPPAMIVDHLVWAYCPLVEKDANLTDVQKANRVRQFAADVAGMVYAPASDAELDIIVSLPIAPAVLGKVDAAAKAGGLSRDAWMNGAIENALPTP